MSGDLSGPMTSDQADDLLAGWRARLDEDEATAQAAAAAADGAAEWHQVVPGSFGGVEDARGQQVVYDEGAPSPSEAAHIARYDPARALREIPGKRLVLDEHLPIESIYGLTCKRCVSWQDAPLAEGGETEFGIAIPDPWPCVPVRAVAASWD